jgi:hypothetical protein
VDWIDLSHDWDKWRTLVYTVMIIGVPFFPPSQYILQSVRGHSAVVLTVTINGMQEIRPVIYLLY